MFITKTLTLEALIALEPKKLWYGANTCWWTHKPEDLCKHPESGLPCDPRGGMLFETQHVKEFFRKAKLSANEGVYGKHGLQAFIAAHNANCQVSEQDERRTCETTWKRYNEQIDEQAKVPVVKPLIRNADLSLGGIPEKTVEHEANMRILDKDDEGGEE